jgi:hypothetical protein
MEVTPNVCFLLYRQMEGGVVVDLRPNVKKLRPHLVILGAGASYATLPNRDKNGNKLPIMNGFMDTIGISHLFLIYPQMMKTLVKYAKKPLNINHQKHLYIQGTLDPIQPEIEV